MAKKRTVRRKVTTILTRNGGTLTESQYFSKIRSALRNGFRYWKPMQQALELSSRPSQNVNKRIKKEYNCAHCKLWFKRVDVEIDHRIECGSLSSYDDVVPFIQRLTQENPASYDILCKPCHKNKTALYRANKKIIKT